MDKLRIIIRSDLEPGAQAVQAVHGLTAFEQAHPEAYQRWVADERNLALLAVPNEPALRALWDAAERAGVPAAAFREPDFGDALTAVALGAGARQLTSSLPKALKRAA